MCGRANNDIAVSRLNPNGSWDRSFGRSGRVLVDFSRESDTARDIALAPKNTIVAAGEATVGGTLRFAAVRIHLA